nr:hypothetical protein [Tanacetum cinerariifolium]
MRIVDRGLRPSSQLPATVPSSVLLSLDIPSCSSIRLLCSMFHVPFNVSPLYSSSDVFSPFYPRTAMIPFTLKNCYESPCYKFTTMPYTIARAICMHDMICFHLVMELYIPGTDFRPLGMDIPS